MAIYNVILCDCAKMNGPHHMVICNVLICALAFGTLLNRSAPLWVCLVSHRCHFVMCQTKRGNVHSDRQQTSFQRQIPRKAPQCAFWWSM